MMNINAYINNEIKYKFKKDTDGKELISLLFKNDVNINDKNIEIINGKLVSGVLSKGELNNKLINYYYDKYEFEDTKLLIDNVQKLLLNWLMIDGFTVGYSDMLLNDETNKKVKDYIQEKKLKVLNMITELENNPDNNDPDVFEDLIKKELECVTPDVGKLVTNGLDNLNNFKLMIKSGSKGSEVNIGQIIGGNG